MRNTYYFFLIPLLIVGLGATYVPINQSLAQSSHSESDSTPISAVIVITNNDQGQAVFKPQKTELKHGQEVLVINNITKTQTFTNGDGKGDSMEGKIFSIEITPHSFAEYLASNISPGNYTFHSKNDPNLKGELVILP